MQYGQTVPASAPPPKTFPHSRQSTGWAVLTDSGAASPPAPRWEGERAQPSPGVLTRSA